MIYRPAPGLAAGSEEEGSFPGPPRTAALQTPVGVLGHSGSQGAHAGAPQGRQPRTLQHPVLLQKLLLLYLRFILAIY